MPRKAGRNTASADRDKVVALINAPWLFTDQTEVAYFIFDTTCDGKRHQQVHAIRSKSGERVLRLAFKDRHGHWPSSQGFRDGLDALEASAHGRRVLVGLRTMPFNGGFAIDLGDDAWTRVIVTADGWSLTNTGPLFRRAQGSLPLPLPVSGGSLDLLRPFINVHDDGDWSMILGWLVYALLPLGPYPILVLQGEQGSSKSTVARVLVSLVDPNAAVLIGAPRDDRDLIVVAHSRHVIALDNLSNIDARLKDWLCRLATGSGLATRKLYSDLNVIVLQATRPIILNGINDLLLADDLTDRAICITLPQIPESTRMPESEFWKAFDRVRFEVFGALLDAAVNGLAAPPLDVGQGNLRMADFAAFASAAAQTWGVTRQEWLQHYRDNRHDVIESGLEASPLAAILRVWIEDRRRWEGTYKDLLEQLNSSVDEATQQALAWPRSPRGLGNQLRYLAPALRTIGIDILELGHRNRGRTVRLESRLLGEHSEHSEHSERSFLFNYEEERRRRESNECKQRSPRSQRSPSSPPPDSLTSGGES
jgi:hypothetical protein